MIKRNAFIIILSTLLILLSVIIFCVHYLIFRDIYYIFSYLVYDLAFLPIEVLLVVIIIERVLNHRERSEKLQKLNMVIGAFFSEVGNYLLLDLLKYFRNKDEISTHLNIDTAWTATDFQRAADFAYHLPVDVDSNSLNLLQLKEFLSKKREFLLTLLESPNIIEDDRFTDLLWAVTHLDEELEARSLPVDLPDGDLEHIAGDIRRMYDHLASEWLDYVQHLKSKYPYLFSLVIRTHPFQQHPSPVIN